MFKINDRVVVREYPGKEMLGREGVVVAPPRPFIEVLIDGRDATLLFKEEELDKVG